MLACNGLLKNGGKIILPNLQCIKESLEDSFDIISPYYEINFIDKDSNPLFTATDKVRRELMKCPDVMTNETQMKPLFEYSEYPFFSLELIDSPATSKERSSDRKSKRIHDRKQNDSQEDKKRIIEELDAETTVSKVQRRG